MSNKFQVGTVSLSRFEATLWFPRWRDVKFGLDQGFIERVEVVHHAERQLASGDDVPTALAVAIAEPYEDVAPLVDACVALEMDTGPPQPRDAWLLVLTAESVRSRSTVESKLDGIESIFVGFDHPEELAGFIRWMPAQHKLFKTREANEAALVAAAREWVDQESSRLRAEQLSA